MSKYHLRWPWFSVVGLYVSSDKAYNFRPASAAAWLCEFGAFAPSWTSAPVPDRNPNNPNRNPKQ